MLLITSSGSSAVLLYQSLYNNYADDTVLYVVSKSVSDLANKINNADLKHIYVNSFELTSLLSMSRSPNFYL